MMMMITMMMMAMKFRRPFIMATFIFCVAYTSGRIVTANGTGESNANDVYL